MECRIVLTHKDSSTEVGMYDPQTDHYAPLGTHAPRILPQIVRDLKQRMEKEGHTVTFCERRHG